MSPRLAAALTATLLALSARSAPAATQLTDVTAYSGVQYSTYTTGGAQPTIIHVVAIDLSSSEVNLVATQSDERGLKPSAFAAARSAQIVINGDLFSPAGFRPAGIARGEAITWEDSSDDELSGFIAFRKTVLGTEAVISDPLEVVPVLEAGVAAAVGGRPMLLASGTIAEIDCDDSPTLACIAAPRTAVATSADGRTLFLVVADGWQAGSAGVSAAELATFLSVDLGARAALQLDAGSASAMFIENQGGLVSSPSDGAERTVANHIAVVHGVLPPGSIQGGVFDTVIGGEMIVGATVTLDTGQEVTYTGEQLWNFVVPPRFVCVTGSADDYQDQTQCRQIFSGQAEFASMALLPDGVVLPDAGGPLADASVGMDCDGGDCDDGGGGGCGCSSAPLPARTGLAMLALLTLAGLRRRRRPLS